jgi:hypothetical protein
MTRTPDVADPAGITDLAKRNIDTIKAEWSTARDATAREPMVG